ncbi:MAG: hypothetical protein HFJ59_04540 [Clostridia bacterium]|nr:hypothetical protein [Clostridia bacterium]
MNTFADYILEERNLAAKMEIAYYLSKKEDIFFDKTVILKTELARLFLKYNKLELDENLVLTACLLCNCKKPKNSRNIEEVKLYAKQGAEYLQRLGFDKKFCKICEEVNRYSESSPREKESDILELVDQFGGMILNRQERIGLKSDEALVLLIHRNLKNKYNRYIESFSNFINVLEEIDMGEFVETKALKQLTKIFNQTDDVVQVIKRVINIYEPNIDKLMQKRFKQIEKDMFEEGIRSNRPLFTEETTRKIMNDIEKRKLETGIV